MAYNEKIEKNFEATNFSGAIPVNYVYTFGIAGEKFFRTIKDKGTFLASKCSSCNKLFVPPQIYCDECFEELREYEDIGIEGEIYSFTECYYDFKGSKYNEPHIIGLIKFKGVEGGIIHRLNLKKEDLKIGTKVVAVFKPQKDREGSLDDILYFKMK